MNKEIFSAQELVEKIKSKGIQPKSKWYFVVLAFMTILSVTCTVFILVYIANLLSVLQKSHEYIRLLEHGSTGIWLLLSSLPYMLIIVFVFSFIITIILLRTFFSLYRISLLQTIAATLAVIAMLAYILLRYDTSLLFLRVFGIESKPLKTFHNYYFSGKQGHIVHGEIVSIEGTQMTLKLSGDDTELHAHTSSSTKGIIVDRSTLPQPVFMLVDGAGSSTRVLYIGHPYQK